MKYDFGKAAGDYAKYRAGFPARLFERLFQEEKIRPGDRVLDLGTGTGTLARGFAQRGCTVTGLDPSPPLLAEAHKLASESGHSINFVEGVAEHTGLPDGYFDVVSAGECWHWFDRAAAAIEVRRVLKPGGLVLIAHFDWLPAPGNVIEATEKLIGKHNEKWKLGGGNGIHPDWFSDLKNAGFHDIESFSFDEDVTYSHEAWRGRVRASAGIGGSLLAEDVATFDIALEKILKTEFPNDPLRVPH